MTSDEKRWMKEKSDIQVALSAELESGPEDMAQGPVWAETDETRYRSIRKLRKQISWLENQLELYARTRHVRQLGEYLS